MNDKCELKSNEASIYIDRMTWRPLYIVQRPNGLYAKNVRTCVTHDEAVAYCKTQGWIVRP